MLKIQAIKYACKMRRYVGYKQRRDKNPARIDENSTYCAETSRAALFVPRSQTGDVFSYSDQADNLAK